MRTTLPTSWGFIAGVDSPETGASVLQDANAVKTKTSFEELFEFVATSDDSAYICVPAALKFRQEICGGEDAIISYNIKLANDAADAVAGQVMSLDGLRAPLTLIDELCEHLADLGSDGAAIVEQIRSVPNWKP